MSTGLNWRRAQVQALLPEAQLSGALDPAPIQAVSTDSRQVSPGDLFVALAGERFDGHDHLAQAVSAGAVAVMVDRAVTVPASVLVIRVHNTRTALGALAGAWRAQWPGCLLAVTGSNGKTTVTQMVAAMLKAKWGDDALATQGNFNNDIGVPLTLLRLRQHHQAAVLELGMNHPGEIAQLAQWARPHAVLVNNAQREHQEFMKTVEAVARENASAFAHVTAPGFAVFPADDAFTPLWSELASGLSIRSFGEGGDVSAVRHTWQGDHGELSLTTPLGPVKVSVHVAGPHNLRNVQAAIALALCAGLNLVDVAEGLAAFRAVSGRSQLSTLDWQGRSVMLLNDTYNANPDSVKAAIDTLVQLPGPHALVLGDMGEVGDQGPAFHEEVGRYAAVHQVAHVLTLGTLSQFTSDALTQGQHHTDLPALLQALDARMPQLGSVCVKGSRFMRMEQVVTHLQAPGIRGKEASCS